MNDIESIYKKLGGESKPTSGGEAYKAYKEEKFKLRLRICLTLHSKGHNWNDLVIKIGQLDPEERERLLQSTSPRDLLNLFVTREGGTISSEEKGNRIKFDVRYKEEYLFQETLSCEKPKRLRRLEILEKENELSLKVLEDMIKQGIIRL